MYEHHEEIYKRYYEEWNLHEMEPLEVVQLIYSKIEELFDKDFKEIEMTLVEYAAVYGHTACIDNMGEWKWNEEKKACIVQNMGGSGLSSRTLDAVIVCYSTRRDFCFGRFDEMLKFRTINLNKK